MFKLKDLFLIVNLCKIVFASDWLNISQLIQCIVVIEESRINIKRTLRLILANFKKRPHL